MKYVEFDAQTASDVRGAVLFVARKQMDWLAESRASLLDGEIAERERVIASLTRVAEMMA